MSFQTLVDAADLAPVVLAAASAVVWAARVLADAAVRARALVDKAKVGRARAVAAGVMDRVDVTARAAVHRRAELTAVAALVAARPVRISKANAFVKREVSRRRSLWELK